MFNLRAFHFRLHFTFEVRIISYEGQTICARFCRAPRPPPYPVPSSSGGAFYSTPRILPQASSHQTSLRECRNAECVNHRSTPSSAGSYSPSSTSFLAAASSSMTLGTKCTLYSTSFPPPLICKEALLESCRTVLFQKSTRAAERTALLS